MAYVNQYRQYFPTQFDMPTIRHRGQAATDAYNAGKAGYENFAAHDAEMARAGYEADQQRLAAQAAWQAQQNAAVANNQATSAGVAAIQQEIAQNEAEIAQLKQELSEITTKYGDADAMDRLLAANRARIGDMGNSLAHQQAINNRFQFQWANKDKIKTQTKALEKEIIDAYREIAWAEDEKSKDVANFNLQNKLKEYKELTGKDYAGNPFANKTGIPNAGDTANTLELAVGKLQKSFDKKGRPSKAAVSEFLKDAEKLPFSQELMNKVLEVQKMTTQEGAKQGYEASKKAVEDSYSQYKDEDIRTEMSVSKKDSITKKVNGKTITFTKDGTRIKRSSGGYSK